MRKREHSPNTLGIEAVLSAFRSILAYRCAVYIAVPITTGRRYYHFRRNDVRASSPDYDRILTKNVVEPNRESARPTIAALRQKLAKPVIDPTQLECYGWTQDDYRSLWRAVIETFSSEVVFLDGWEYSQGCAYEFLVACQQRLPMYRETLTSLSLEEGRRLLASACDDLKVGGIDASMHTRVLKDLGLVSEDLKTP